MKLDQFDGLEIHPCRVYSVEDGITFIEQCEPEEAGFWSVYGHYKIDGEGIECLKDFKAEAEARKFAQKLLDLWPNLNVFGLLG